MICKYRKKIQLYVQDLSIYFTAYKKTVQEKKEGRQNNTVHIYASLRLKREKKTETTKLSDYINNIYEFTRPYERYYSDCVDITDIDIIIRIYKWNEKGNYSALMWYL